LFYPPADSADDAEMKHKIGDSKKKSLKNLRDQRNSRAKEFFTNQTILFASLFYKLKQTSWQ